MRLQIFRYKCGQCHELFEGPEIGAAYGEFLLRSPTGEMRYLNAIDDEVYGEVSRLLVNEPKVVLLDELKKAEVLQKIFGIACGNAFQIGIKPSCPNCHGSFNDTWGAVYPPKSIEIDVLPVTHNSWKVMSEAEKALALHPVCEGIFQRPR